MVKLNIKKFSRSNVDIPEVIEQPKAEQLIEDTETEQTIEKKRKGRPKKIITELAPIKEVESIEVEEDINIIEEEENEFLNELNNENFVEENNKPVKESKTEATEAESIMKQLMKKPTKAKK